MMEHTKEPWVIDEREELATNFYSDDATGSIIGCVPNYKFAPRSLEERKANARRIVACVNALSGLTTEQIEEGVFTKLRAERDALLVDRDNWREDARALRESQERLWKQRDELRAALKDLLSDMRLRAQLEGDVDSTGCVVLNCGHSVLLAAETALANAKGGSQ